MKYKLAIFDFDGTLANSFPWFMSVVNDVADKYTFKRIETHDIDLLRGYSARRVMQHLGIPIWKMPMIGNYMLKRMTQDIAQISLFEGVDELLHQLSSNGVKLTIVSSNSWENIRRVLGPKNAGLIRDHECGASIFGKQAKFRKILRRNEVLPSEAICIGDEIRDIEAAKKEQIPFGAVTWGATRLEALEAHGPAEVFARVEDIVAKILFHGNRADASDVSAGARLHVKG